MFQILCSVISTNNLVASTEKLITLTQPYSITGGSSETFVVDVTITVIDVGSANPQYYSSAKLVYYSYFNSYGTVSYTLLSRFDSSSNVPAINCTMDASNIYVYVQIPTSDNSKYVRS